MEHETQAQIFDGVRILDFTQVIAGSYATAIMGDMGAEVIKVEPPLYGDTLRLSGPMYHGESGYFIFNNRNKKSISVNLKTEEGKNLIRELIPKADIMAENFKPGVMKDNFQLGYEDVCKIKKDIIYVSVSGYGHGNDYSARPAYDNIIQGEAGLASLNGFPAPGVPLRSPLSIADFTAGLYAAFAMASALLHRNKTGQGQYIDIAMYDALISIMDNTFLIYQLNRAKINEEIAQDPAGKDKILEQWGLKSTGSRHPGAAPHGFFKTRDGYIAHMSLTNEMWKKLLDIIGKGDLKDDQRYDDLSKRKGLWQEIEKLIEAWTTQYKCEEVLKILQENGLPCGKIRTIDEVYEDPHNAQRGIFQAVVHPVAGKVEITNVPIKMSQTPPKIKAPSPLLGEHNYEVLSTLLGYSKEKVDELVKRKVLY